DGRLALVARVRNRIVRPYKTLVGRLFGDLRRPVRESLGRVRVSDGVGAGARGVAVAFGFDAFSNGARLDPAGLVASPDKLPAEKRGERGSEGRGGRRPEAPRIRHDRGDGAEDRGSDHATERSQVPPVRPSLHVLGELRPTAISVPDLSQHGFFPTV